MRPGAGEACVALSVGRRRTPAIVSVTADGSVRVLDLRAMPETSAPLDRAPAASLTFPDGIPGRSFTVTRMQWRDGELYLAGLSKQSFASSVRIIPVPFGVSASIIHMFSPDNATTQRFFRET